MRNTNSELQVPRVKIPIWRRLTALVSLGSLVVVLGAALAALLGIGAVVTLLIIERAAG